MDTLSPSVVAYRQKKAEEDALRKERERERRKQKTEWQKEWQKDNPEEARIHARKMHLRKTYSMSYEEYEEMLKAQDGKCKICGTTEPGRGRKYFCVDHNQKTGKVRKLLCFRCNVALGGFNDDVELLHKAIAYLEENQ